MSKFIHRAQMPQVDFDDLPRLVMDAYTNTGVSFEVERVVDLHSHQYVHHDRALSMPDEVAMKPLLVSSDGGILDGNHRWFHALHNTQLVNVIKLNTTFDDALDWLGSLPYVYHIDKTTPLRN